MAWYTDRGWMYEKTDSNGFLNSEYCDNVELFLDFAFSKEEVVDTWVNMHGETKRNIKCPCYKCQNISYRDRATVQKHLFKDGFMLRYEIWSEHGEKSNHDVGQSSTTMEIDDDDDDGCKRMVLDNLCSCDYTSSTLEGRVPNPEAKRFYDMLEAADEPLWEGEKATSFSKLQAATSFLTWKSLFNVSTAAYNFNISMINAMLPENNKLPKSFYDTKKSLEPLSLPYERIDVCKNHCMIFYKQDKALTHCKYCKESRYKSVLNKVPNLVMWYMPIGPRLKRLYMSTKTAKDMTWHHDHKTKEGSMAHPSDGMAWKHFDSENPDFAKEIRNVRLGLCTDGFNPNNSNSIPYSLWPVFLTIYNLPPWMSMKDSFIEVINAPNKEHLRDLAQGPLTYVKSHKGYFVNGYKFHTKTAYDGRVTQNSGVCVKGASYNEHENDYYGLLDEILELEYHSTIGRCVVVLFKCTWFDPVRGVRVDPKTHMVDVKPTATGCVDDPFILASQAQQVYYTSYPSKSKELKGWLAVVKTTPRGVYELDQDVSEIEDDDVDMEPFFQENERIECTVMDDLLPISLVHEDGRLEEVEDTDGDNDEKVEFEATTLADEDFHILLNFDDEDLE
ncbi:putative Transposase-associated domain-containing protein [Helianthus annuus]|nr:uncharacterized protein LOC110941629 [Helianthus annuus]XP_022038992.1 uncharacterized protein LOC110941633 [Helianthus annuus]KAJ0585549.1 putative Transposase-associated domain-containing protein [Helianthus annuus]KAJ0585552.1 putative Transposase-associated domain-containing protein [Helianthus annuus]KAJ0665672.1 putative Transposase-associated domain-containing protein [Helianthus annuus]KAJ0923801.1 putative Transposase-associated domain-containing protein [Helianthus annuus]